MTDIDIDRQALIDALDAFKRATANLGRVWADDDFDGSEMEGTYPDCLPDFAEVALAVAEMQVVDATTCQVCGRAEAVSERF